MLSSTAVSFRRSPRVARQYGREKSHRPRGLNPSRNRPPSSPSCDQTGPYAQSPATRNPTATTAKFLEPQTPEPPGMPYMPPFGSSTRQRQSQRQQHRPGGPPSWPYLAGAAPVPCNWRRPLKLVPYSWRTTVPFSVLCGSWRPRQTVVTNRVESFHNFSKWLSFGNAGVIADNDPRTHKRIIKFNELRADDNHGPIAPSQI